MYARFVSIPYVSFLSKTSLLLHPLPITAHLILLPYLGLHSSSVQPAGELLLLRTPPAAGVLKNAEGGQAAKE